MFLESNITSPHSAVVIGGAPRDWFRGEPCNDIDVYIQTNKHTRSLIATLKRSFGDVTEVKGDYDGMQHVHYIINVPFTSAIIQLIFVKDNSIKEAVGRSGCSLSQIVWDPATDKYQASREFLFDLENKDITFYRTDKYRHCNTQYLKKMTERFPDHFAFMQDAAHNGGKVMALEEYLKITKELPVKGLFDDSIPF